MNIIWLADSKLKGLWRYLGFCSILAFVCVGLAPAQGPMEVRRNIGSTAVLQTYVEIPTATVACAPEECEWWERLRAAGNELQRKGDKKSTRQFVFLLVEGMEKAHSVPLEDRSPQLLHLPPPELFPRGFRFTSGKVELLIEYAAEGSVGDVKLLSGLRSDLDQRCIRWKRESIFLPAVKDGKFVTEWRTVSCGFHTSRIGR